jgi:hypothetical protein
LDTLNHLAAVFYLTHHVDAFTELQQTADTQSNQILVFCQHDADFIHVLSDLLLMSVAEDAG